MTDAATDSEFNVGDVVPPPVFDKATGRYDSKFWNQYGNVLVGSAVRRGCHSGGVGTRAFKHITLPFMSDLGRAECLAMADLVPLVLELMGRVVMLDDATMKYIVCAKDDQKVHKAVLNSLGEVRKPVYITGPMHKGIRRGILFLQRYGIASAAA